MEQVLVILAHHDDEFFLAPVIRDETQAGAAVTVAFLTHGSLDGSDGATRAAESRAVLTGLGVAEARIQHLGESIGAGDGALYLNGARALAVLRERHGGTRFQRVYLMAWEGGHPDHDAAHQLGAAFAAGSGARLFEFPLYNSCRTPPGKFQLMTPVPRPGSLYERKLTPAEAEACFALTAAYPSQRQVFELFRPGIRRCLFERASYQFRELPQPLDYAKRPHAGPLFYEQRFGLAFGAFRAAMQAVAA